MYSMYILYSVYSMYKLSGFYSGYWLSDSLLGFSSPDNKFALEELAVFIFRVSECGSGGCCFSIIQHNPRDCHQCKNILDFVRNRKWNTF
jgi:hypothetical protein